MVAVFTMRQPDNYTKLEPQAEALVFDQIERRYISAILIQIDKTTADVQLERKRRV